MKLKNIIYEDFVNYKKTSMFILTTACSFKCECVKILNLLKVKRLKLIIRF